MKVLLELNFWESMFLLSISATTFWEADSLLVAVVLLLRYSDIIFLMIYYFSFILLIGNGQKKKKNSNVSLIDIYSLR